MTMKQVPILQVAITRATVLSTIEVSAVVVDRFCCITPFIAYSFVVVVLLVIAFMWPPMKPRNYTRSMQSADDRTCGRLIDNMSTFPKQVKLVNETS